MNKLGYFLLLLGIVFAFQKYGVIFVRETVYLLSGDDLNIKVQNIEVSKNNNKYVFFIDGIEYSSMWTKKKLRVNEKVKARTIPFFNMIHFGAFQLIIYLLFGFFFVFLCIIFYLAIKNILL